MYERGAYEHSYQLLNEALGRSRVVGDPRLVGFISAYFGQSARKLDRIVDIEGVLRESARVTQEVGDRFGYGLVLEQLALAAQAKGDLATAEQLFEASVILFREIGDPWSLARMLTSWGDFRRSLGELTQAAEYIRQAIKLALNARAFSVALNALVLLAQIYAQEDQASSALEITIHVIEHPAGTEDARTSAHELRLDLESTLSSNEVEAAYKRARAETLEEFASVSL